MPDGTFYFAPGSLQPSLHVFELSSDDDEPVAPPRKKRQRLGYESIATIGNGISIRPSTIPGAGSGLFAERDFQAREIITKYEGEIIPVPRILPAREHTTHWAGFMRGWVIKGIKTPVSGVGGGSFMNHISRGANAEFVRNDNPDRRNYGMYVVARRHIKKGEEILIRYGDHGVAELAGVS
jgi:hypothetical protein